MVLLLGTWLSGCRKADDKKGNIAAPDFYTENLEEATTEVSTTVVTEEPLRVAFASGVGLTPTDSRWKIDMALADWCDKNQAEYAVYEDEESISGGKIPSVKAALSKNPDIVVYYSSFGVEEICKAARRHPKTFFLLLNCENEGYYDYSEDKNIPFLGNVGSVYCDGLLTAYISGYASVRLGFREIGVLSQFSGVLSDVYLQGVDQAVAETGNNVHVRIVENGGYFCECGAIEKEQPGVASRWCQDGVDLVYTPIGGYWLTSLIHEDLLGSETCVAYEDNYHLTSSDEVFNRCAWIGVVHFGNVARWIMDELSKDGGLETYGGKTTMVGIVNPECPFDNPIMPWKSTKWTEDFAEEDYRLLLKRIYDGELSYEIGDQWSMDYQPYEPVNFTVERN